MKILVVDDNTVNLAAVEKALKNKYEVIPMISGRRALKLLYVQKVDLILLDVEMPEMNGIETLAEIRKIEGAANTPVIFLTAKKDKQTVLEGFKLKIMDYVVKPFDAENLVSRVDFTLKRAGALEFDKAEMYSIIGSIINRFGSGDSVHGRIKLIEATNYKTDDEILGRIKFALEKLEAGDATGALNVLNRIRKMLSAELGIAESTPAVMSQTEIKERLSVIAEDLDNFRTKDATAKCKELIKCPLPKIISDLLNKSLEYLSNYDDEEAEKIIKNLVKDL